MYNKDIYEQLALKFSYLSNLKPNGVKSKINLWDVGLNDKFVQKFNPSRYSFYMKLLKAFTNPKVLKNVLYEHKLIKANKQEEQADIEEISNLLERLLTISSDKTKHMSDKDYIEEKKKIVEDTKKELKTRLKLSMKMNYSNEDAKVEEFIDRLLDKEDKYDDNSIKKGGSPGNMTEKEVDDMKEKINVKAEEFKKKGLNVYTDKLKKLNDNNDLDDTVKAQKLNDVLFELEDNTRYSIKKFDITKEDKLVFVGVIFVIRMLSLMIIDWSMTSNFVVNFYQAYLLYIALYCIFLLLVVVVVNFTYIMPIQKLYDGENTFANTLASVFYFFYLVPGKMYNSSLRLIVHLGIIILMTIIALFIVYTPQNANATINYDYAEKRNIRTQLNNFTLILWIVTSMIVIAS